MNHTRTVFAKDAVTLKVETQGTYSSNCTVLAKQKTVRLFNTADKFANLVQDNVSKPEHEFNRKFSLSETFSGLENV
jgi:hypothetical protein